VAQFFAITTAFSERIFLLVKIMNELVTQDLTTTSMAIAELFGRDHKSVLRTIRGIVKDMSNDELTRRKIEQCFKINKLANNKSEPYFILGEEITLVITGRLTGKNALIAQLKLADAFIEMRDYIRYVQKNAIVEFQKQLSAQSSQLALINQREPRDEKTLAVIMNCPTRQVTKHFDILVRNGYLNRKELPPVTRYTYEATQQLGVLCIGKKGESLLFDDKVKDLIGLLNQTESLFD
jgi:phage regulator Rha-like protein